MQPVTADPHSWRRTVVVTILSLTVAGAIVALQPGRVRLIARVEIAIVGLITVVSAAGVLRRAAPLAPRSPLDRVPRSIAVTGAPLPRDLVRISRRLAAAEASAADSRRHLGPLAGAIAADRLRRRSHTPVDQDSVYAHLPGPVAPELALVLDPALVDVDTRAMPGLDADGTDALVRALEQL
jgi:hypothetical protein